MKYDETYEDYLDFLYEVRMKVKQLRLEKRQQNILLQEVLKLEYIQNQQKRGRFLQELAERVCVE